MKPDTKDSDEERENVIRKAPEILGRMPLKREKLMPNPRDVPIKNEKKANPNTPKNRKENGTTCIEKPVAAYPGVPLHTR